MTTKLFTVPFRRKISGKTSYKKRLSLLKSKKLRLVIRKSNKHMSVQLVKYGENGDVVVESAHSKELSKHGWSINSGNLPAAYLTGFLLGVRSKGKEAVVDIGLQAVKSSRLFAAVKGACDAGLKITVSHEVLPPEERSSGQHIAAYYESLKEKKDNLFSSYLKNKKDPSKIKQYFEETKENILKNN